MKKKITSILLMTLILTTLVFANGANEQTQNIDDIKVLKLASSMDSGVLSPFRHVRRGPGIFKMQLIYDSLLETGVDKDIPWLAKSYEFNEDKTEYVFHLQENVKWHDQKPFSADDVVFTINYYKEHPPVRNYLIDNGRFIIKDIQKIDNNTVKAVFVDFSPTYLHRLGSTRIIPKHIWENVTDPMKFEGDGCTIGCGPFVLTNYEPEKKAYRFEAFKDYWGKKTVADVLEFLPVSNSILAFENNEIDITTVSPDMLSKFENQEDCKIQKYHSQHSFRMYFNMKDRPELEDKNIRKAFAYGIDRQSIMEKITRGYGEITPMGYLLKEHSMYNPNINDYPYDCEKAKELLNGKTLEFNMLVSNKPRELKLAELIKIDLEKIGIKVNVKSVEYKSRDAMVRKGDYELAIIYSGGMGSEANMLKDYFYSYSGKKGKGGIVIGYSNPDLDKILDSQATERNDTKRKEMIFAAQEMIADDVPVLMLFGDIEICAYRPSKNESWTGVYNHSKIYHPKLSFLER